MESLNTSRIELHDDETRVCFTNYRSLVERDDNPFWVRVGTRHENETVNQIAPNLVATADYKAGTLSVAYAGVVGEETLVPSIENLYTVTVDVRTREPTEAELQPYEESFHDGPSEVYEISLPPLEHFLNPSKYKAFTIPFRTEQLAVEHARHLQKQIETRKWRYIKSTRPGNPTNLEPEYDPTYGLNEAENAKGYNEGAYNSTREHWQELFGFRYASYLDARFYATGTTERRLSATERVILDLVDWSENESYCEFCGRIDDAHMFLNLTDRSDASHRVCVSCGHFSREFSEEDLRTAVDNHETVTEEDIPNIPAA